MVTLEEAVKIAKSFCGEELRLSYVCEEIEEGYVFAGVRKDGKPTWGLPLMLVYKNDGSHTYEAYYPGREFAKKIDAAKRIDITELVEKD